MNCPVFQRGFLIIAAMALLVIVSFLVLALGYIFTGDVTSSGTHAQSAKALFIAETGIEHNTSRLLSPNLAPPVTALTRLPCNAALNETVAYGGGEYEVRVRNLDFTADGAVPVYAAGATLAAPGINATANIIPVNSTAGYASRGRIMIDRELIDYHGITPAPAASFINAVRGMDGSTAAPHATLTRVGHYQCNLLSQGAVSSFANPDGLRRLNVGVQLQEGWAVGNGGNIFRWNGTAWVGAGAAPAQLNSVSMLSYSDGWAVGINSGGELLMGWNGAAWARQPVQAAIPNQNLNSVYCVATNDCWAVGNNHGGGGGAVAGETILRWLGGPNWARWPVSPAIPNVPLLSVNCVKSDDCWIVGNQSGGELLLHWDGAAWARWPVQPGLPNVNMRSVYLIGARQRPQAGWQEDYQ